MKVISLAAIEIRKRQRVDFDSKPLSELEASILNVGLLHPPVCWFDGNVWVLTTGERRYRVISKLSKEQKTFRHGDIEIQPGLIPITPLGDYLDELGRFEAELDENIHRVDLSWQERAQAFSDLHEMRQRANPKQTYKETGQELVEKTSSMNNVVHAAQAVREATIVAAHLSDPKIAAARTQNEALALVYKKEEEKVLAALSKRSIVVLKDRSALDIKLGDLTTLLPQMDEGTTDLILADPPYGIGAGSAGFRARTVHHHNYEDTPANAQDVARTILTEGFRICKPRANILIFCDIELFDWLKATANNMGWVSFKRPLIWRKSESEGMAPWGGSGPRITTEFIFYATKGQRGMVSSPVDVFEDKRVPRNERLHAAEKPVSLLSKLIQCCTLPGDLVLDPCCGSGSTIVACRETNRRGIGIEKDPDYYNTALANIARQKEPTCPS